MGALPHPLIARSAGSPQNVMYMQRIEEKIGGKRPGVPGKAGELQYSSPEELRADFKRIYDNCMTYNEPGVSAFNYPAARSTVDAMLKAVDQALAKQQRTGTLAAALAAANVGAGGGGGASGGGVFVSVSAP